MTDLADFLLARIAEDQALAEAVGPSPVVQADDLVVRDFLQVWHPARVLAECEAKRRLIEDAGSWGNDVWRLLGLPYAGHPDYREEWKP